MSSVSYNGATLQEITRVPQYWVLDNITNQTSFIFASLYLVQCLNSPKQK